MKNVNRILQGALLCAFIVFLLACELIPTPTPLPPTVAPTLTATNVPPTHVPTFTRTPLPTDTPTPSPTPTEVLPTETLAPTETPSPTPTITLIPTIKPGRPTTIPTTGAESRDLRYLALALFAYLLTLGGVALYHRSKT